MNAHPSCGILQSFEESVYIMFLMMQSFSINFAFTINYFDYHFIQTESLFKAADTHCSIGILFLPGHLLCQLGKPYS